ncbi:MAG: DUF167 domain-containing protein [Bdellovibrionales bacterium]|nr:DUF167 domain-containing protein [Bdellovibrionales bacterium]
MRINVQVKLGSKKESVERQSDGSLIVRVNAPPVEGRANERIIELLSDYFDSPKSKISLIQGAKSKKKVFEVL